MLNWDDIRVFLAVARAGSFSGAARILASNQPTIGRRIDQLEQALNTRLFIRHPRGLSVTEDGLRLLGEAQGMETAAAGLGRFTSKGNQVEGFVRIAAPEGLASFVIAPALNTLFDAHPGLSVELVVSPHFSDLARSEADIALRLDRPKVKDLVVKKVGTMRFGLFAQPNLVGSDDPRIIAYGERLAHLPENQWLLKSFPQASIVLKSDNTMTRVQAGLAGLGALVLPTFIGHRAGSLTEHPVASAPPSREVWIVVHENLRRIRHIRIVMEFLTDAVHDALN